jgi:hypothetical protein
VSVEAIEVLIGAVGALVEAVEVPVGAVRALVEAVEVSVRLGVREIVVSILRIIRCI